MIAPRQAFEKQPPAFDTGDLVRHRLYGYRGVVVAVDDSCQASDAWYAGNQTQPSREQPWYHVLVDGSTLSTYAAQSNLEPDDKQQCIVHPWVNLYFYSFEGRHYTRNDTPWPHGAP